MRLTAQQTAPRASAAQSERVTPGLLARRLASRPLPGGAHKQYLLGIIGAPGSGKSTFAEQLKRWLPDSITVPMDGYHLPKAALDQMPDPAEAYARRGAPFTFDAGAFVDTLREIRRYGGASFPTFDHAEADPKHGAPGCQVNPDLHRLVIVEGLYLLLDQAPWDEIAALLDDTIFLDVPLPTAMERVYRRQVSNGLASEEAFTRVLTNDLPNGQLVAASKARATHVILPALDPPQPAPLAADFTVPAPAAQPHIVHVPGLIPAFPPLVGVAA